MSARHLYVHLPFCAHRCGYCDFVTVVGRGAQHRPYVAALLGELELERPLLDDQLETVFVGGGTPTFTAIDELERLLASLPAARETTVEANPETVTPELARVLSRNGVDRVSIGAQTFDTGLLGVLERRATRGDVVRAFSVLRDAGFDNINLDFVYGVPGQTAADVARDIDDAIALDPEHMSWYELEAKPGTRFTHAHGGELARQSDAMETYFELVVDRLGDGGYRWYETANFCRVGDRDLRAQHNLAYWGGRDYLGLGIGAVSTVGMHRWRNAPSLRGYIAALSRGERPRREHEQLSEDVRRRERVMLGLRLDEPFVVGDAVTAIDGEALARFVRLGLAATVDDGAVTLTRRGRFLGGGVTAELLT